MFALSLQKKGRELKSTVRPNRVAAQAFELDSGGKTGFRASLIVPLRIRRKTGAIAHDGVDPAAFSGGIRNPINHDLFGKPVPTFPDRALAADHPYQDKADDRRSDADNAQNIVRRRQRALHGPAHPGRACREQKPFKHKQNTHTDEEVGERYGPHRTLTSRLMLFLLFSRG
jgi:hypothetical protein